MSNRTKKTTVEETVVGNTEDLPQVKIAVMNNDIKHINDSLGRIESKFDTAIQSFATNQQLTDSILAGETKHKEYEKELEKLRSGVEALQNIDSMQQGSIDANRRFVNVVLILLGFVVTAVATYVGLHK